jgi:hypothetical protein
LSEELKLGGAKDYSVGKIRDVNSLSLTKCMKDGAKNIKEELKITNSSKKHERRS